ncbi:MAG: hypothetical protein R6V06_05670 [Kiritimatiellia bacterium]
MARSEIIALMMDGENLRGVRYVPKGSSGLSRAGGGVWPITEASVEGMGDIAPDEIPEDEDSPLLKALKLVHHDLGGRDVVVAFPLSSLLLRILKMPIEMRDDLADAVVLQMDKISPFDDGEYSTGFEVLSEDEENVWVLAAAMSNAVFNEINEPLQKVGWRVVRSDIALLGWLRVLCGPFKLNGPGRRIVLSRFRNDWALMVMNHGTLVMARSFGCVRDYDALVRELTLSMMNVEVEAGPLSVVEILVVAEERPEQALFDKLSDLFSVEPEYRAFPSMEGGVEGVALRSYEQDVVDLTPDFWHAQLKENAIRKKVVVAVSAACAVWVLLMAGLFSGPLVYQHLAKRVQAKSRGHYREYKAVSDTRKRVELILSYTDRQYSPLEIMRVVSSYLPQGIILTAFNYKRQDGVRISGEADQPTLVYEFKNAVTADELFDTVNLDGPSASRGKHKFEVHAEFRGGVEE